MKKITLITGIDQKHPRGSVLLFTLCILALMMILGATLFLATQDELYVSSDNTVSRDAFSKADLTARMAVFLARASLDESVGSVSSSLSPGGVSGRPEFVVGMNNFTQFINDDHDDAQSNIRKRYILAAGGEIDLTGDGPVDPAIKPHVTVEYEYGSGLRQMVGTAAVAVSYVQPLTQKENVEIPTYLIVTADGRVPVGDTAGEDDPSNFFTGKSSAKHGIVTTIYKEVPQ